MIKNKKIRILMNGSPGINNFNAQDLNYRYIASYLDKDLFEIYFLDDQLHGKIDSKLNKENIHIIKIPSYSPNRQIIRLKYKLLYHYDIYFSVKVFYTEILFLTLIKLLKKNIKTVHWIENKLPYKAGGLYNLYGKFAALYSTKTISISSSVAKDATKYYGINSDIISAGVDTTIFKPYTTQSRSNNRLKIISCGTLQSRKQPLLFIEIARKFPNVDFIWIGEGPLKADILKTAKEVNNFKLLSNMQHIELANYFAQSDIFLFPSIQEGSPKVVLEAMAAGLPVIVFAHYEPEMVVNGITGFIVNNKEEMIKKLKILIENENLRKKFGKMARRRAIRYFDWRIITKKFEKIFLKMIYPK